jgi:hypothetical protein
MIHEYALEPELVATWGNRQDFRYFVEKFGLGQPRIVSRYPKPWKRLVWQAFQSSDDLERTRMVELLQRLSERMVHRRGYQWDPGRAWSENARAEHVRAPFHAIVVARENPDGHARVLVAAELNDATPLWAVPRGVPIARRAADMAAAVAAMLRIAEIVVFVDPYFGPDRSRHRRTLEAFLRATTDGRVVDGPARLEVQTSADEERTGTRVFFEAECQRRLPGCIPAGARLRVVRLVERPGGEGLHNRYILTDLGGVLFGAGLDEGDHGTTDDLVVLDRAQYEMRWQQHAGGALGFDQPEPPVEIQGA